MTHIFKGSLRLSAGCLACLWAVIIAGCGKPSIVGLHPEAPPATRKGMSLQTDFVEVDTLTPTFRWQPLAIRIDSPADQEPARIENITYEIRIWRTVSSDAGKLVYQRSRLTATEHHVEQALDYVTRYLWSVRAHFAIDGKNRTTEWTLGRIPASQRFGSQRFVPAVQDARSTKHHAKVRKK
jgi:hypothetical protein